MSSAAKSFDIPVKLLTFQFERLPYYFDGPIKLFSDPYLGKFLDTSTTKLSFPCDVTSRELQAST